MQFVLYSIQVSIIDRPNEKYEEISGLKRLKRWSKFLSLTVPTRNMGKYQGFKGLKGGQVSIIDRPNEEYGEISGL